MGGAACSTKVFMQKESSWTGPPQQLGSRQALQVETVTCTTQEHGKGWLGRPAAHQQAAVMQKLAKLDL